MNRKEAKLDPAITEAEENLLIDFQFLVQDLINLRRISRAELARRAGITKARLSQILSAEANPTVRTFARLFHALNAKVELKHTEKQQIILPHSVERQWDVTQLPVRKLSKESAKTKAQAEAIAQDWRDASNDNCAVVVDSAAKSLRLKVA